MSPATPETRREDFSLESFKYLEAKLQVIRKLAMDRAAEVAAVADANPHVYRVEKDHIDDALAQIVMPEIADAELGARRLNRRVR